MSPLQNIEDLDQQPQLRHDNHAEVRMRLSKIGPVAALALSGVGLWLLAFAPLGWRMGWWQYAFGLYWMMPVSGLVAAVAVILSFPS